MEELGGTWLLIREFRGFLRSYWLCNCSSEPPSSFSRKLLGAMAPLRLWKGWKEHDFVNMRTDTEGGKLCCLPASQHCLLCFEDIHIIVVPGWVCCLSIVLIISYCTTKMRRGDGVVCKWAGGWECGSAIESLLTFVKLEVQRFSLQHLKHKTTTKHDEIKTKTKVKQEEWVLFISGGGSGSDF